MGAPGSGKGTISKKIVNELNLEFLSSGDLLRNEITSKSGNVKILLTFVFYSVIINQDILYYETKLLFFRVCVIGFKIE